MCVGGGALLSSGVSPRHAGETSRARNQRVVEAKPLFNGRDMVKPMVSVDPCTVRADLGLEAERQ